MKFKEWLLTEDFDDSGSDWFYGSRVYPSDAFDWQYAHPYPGDFLFLQSRWEKERDQWGRKFHGFDPERAIKQKFTAIYSNTMPDTSEQGWKHSTKERPEVKIDNDAKLYLTGHRKKAEVANILDKSNDLIDKTKELNKIFGEFKPNMLGLPTNFDEPWSPYSGSVKMKYPKRRTFSKKLNNFS